jgi:N-acetylmuramoyl-L-alanine amidase
MKIKLFVISILITLVTLPLALFAQNKVNRIVLDAGHGGKDPGAIGAISNEKTITLAVVLRLGKIISDSLPSVKTIYTRTTDVYPSLKERHEIANQANGDLLISVHVNSTAPRKETIRTGTRSVGKGKKKRQVPVYKTIYHRETSTSGTETYVLGLHRNSQKEKAIGEFGESIMDEPGLLDESDPTTAIIIGQYSQSFLSRSVSLAGKIQQNFAAQGRADLGVKQKGLEVLAGSAMPGVLVEIGFINNPAEERYLNSEAGINEVAMALFKAIKAYKMERERGR